MPCRREADILPRVTPTRSDQTPPRAVWSVHPRCVSSASLDVVAYLRCVALAWAVRGHEEARHGCEPEAGRFTPHNICYGMYLRYKPFCGGAFRPCA